MFLYTNMLEQATTPFPLQFASRIDPTLGQRCSLAGFTLLREGLTQFLALDRDPLCRENTGPLWVAVSGHVIAPGNDRETDPSAANASNTFARTIAEQLDRNPDLEALQALSGSYCLLLAAPSRNWWMLMRSQSGGRTAFHALKGTRVALSDRAYEVACLYDTEHSEDPGFMASYFNFNLGPALGRSAFRDVAELLPGERIECCSERVIHIRHSIAFNRDRKRLADRTYIDNVRETFERAVRRVTESAKHPCVMLSGGLDSSPTAAVLQSVIREKGGNATAISWELPRYPESDEGSYIRETAKFLGLDLILFDGSENLPFSALGPNLAQIDGPYYNPYNGLVDRVYGLAKDHGHDVIINGAGGDHLYPHPNFVLADVLRRGELSEAFRWFRQGLKIQGIRNFHKWPPLRFAIKRLVAPGSRFTSPPKPWLTEQAQAALHTLEFPTDASSHWCRPFAERLLGTAVSFGSSYENMRIEPLGIERREPFQDPELIRLFLEMPFSMTYRNNVPKFVMRKAMEGQLPERIINKDRTGILSSFLIEGFYQNSDNIRELLRERDEWRQWVRPELIARALDRQRASHMDRAIAGLVIAYSLWKERLRTNPGIG